MCGLIFIRARYRCRLTEQLSQIPHCRYGKPRAATVIALTNGKLWALDRRVFRTVVMKSSSANARRDIIRALSKVELLKCLTLQQTQRLSDLLNEVSFSAGEYIIRQGEKGDILS